MFNLETLDKLKEDIIFNFNFNQTDVSVAGIITMLVLLVIALVIFRKK